MPNVSVFVIFHFQMLLLLLQSCWIGTKVQDEDIPHNEVRNWATKLGVNMGAFGKQMTNIDQIKQNYMALEVEVRRKDGLILSRELAEEVENFMELKTSGILRLMDSIEQASQVPYDNSFVKDKLKRCDQLKGITVFDRPKDMYEMAFQNNRQFAFNLVNTSFSCLLIPSSVTFNDKMEKDLQWIERLTPIYVPNYMKDPSIKWQYFGSAEGVLHRYPATKWPPQDVLADVQDFRLTDWYVGAATSPKDIIILLDTSDSLSSHSRMLAKETVKVILETLNVNDFVNIFTTDAENIFLVPCFKDNLVQATPKRKWTLMKAVRSARHGGSANITSSLKTAFEWLQRYNLTYRGSQCNQAIMVITDKLSSTYDAVFKMYNSPHKPVRIFTYLVNKRSDAERMKFIACDNKGFYHHIENFNEIRTKVLSYIEVMTRPMVMYQKNHIIHWTPVFMGGKENTFNKENARFEPMITISASAFDYRNYSTRVAKILGVVAIDVPVKEIKKSVPPYKLGVDGYSFLMNNNGHLIYHPDLRFLQPDLNYLGTLKPTYTGVDLSEVEHIDWPHRTNNNNSMLHELRKEMLENLEREYEVTIKREYDNMRRVSVKDYKYHFHPIKNTPFILGIVLPIGYGGVYAVAEEEIKRSDKHVLSYFEGKNWKVHPEWLYCEYYFPELHHFDNAEEQILHFIERSIKSGWKWMSKRPTEDQSDVWRLDKHSYYCDKGLFQSVVKDAIVTKDFEIIKDYVPDKANEDNQGFQQFGETTTFVATHSGFMRWHDHPATPGSTVPPTVPPFHPNSKHFSRSNSRSIDELWYRRAVEYYDKDPTGWIYSVPLYEDFSKSKSMMVTASRAVFVESKGMKAPIAVVGFQLHYENFALHFTNITSTCTGECSKTCASSDLDCYLLDNHGYVVVSKRPERTGQFFGEIDGTIMDSLVQDGIYIKAPVTDHQAKCDDNELNSVDGASTIISSSLFQWAFWALSWLISHLSIFGAEGVQMYKEYEDYSASHNNRIYSYDEHAPRASEDYAEMREEEVAGRSTVYMKTYHELERAEVIGNDEESSEKKGSSDNFFKIRRRRKKGLLSKSKRLPRPPPFFNDHQLWMADDGGSPTDDKTLEKNNDNILYNDGPSKAEQQEQQQRLVDIDRITDDLQRTSNQFIGLTDKILYANDRDQSKLSNGQRLDPIAMPETSSTTTSAAPNFENPEKIFIASEEDMIKYKDKLQVPPQYVPSQSRFDKDPPIVQSSPPPLLSQNPQPQLSSLSSSGSSSSYSAVSTGRRCTKTATLYVLQPNRLNASGRANPLKGKLTNCHQSGCERPFSVQKVPHSNLILLVVDALCPCVNKLLTVAQQEIGNDQNCDLTLDSLFRRRPPHCFNYHPEEVEILECGSASQLSKMVLLIWLSITIHFYPL